MTLKAVFTFELRVYLRRIDFHTVKSQLLSSCAAIRTSCVVSLLNCRVGLAFVCIVSNNPSEVLSHGRETRFPSIPSSLAFRRCGNS